MSTHVESPASSKSDVAGVTIPAVVFELEGIATGGRKIVFDIAKHELDAHDVKLSHAVFAHVGAQTSPRFYLDTLLERLGASKVPSDSFKETVRRKFSERLGHDKVTLQPGLEKLITSATHQGSRVGVVSALPEDTAQAIFERLGLGEMGAQLFAFPQSEEHFPGADVWLKVAKGVGRTPRHCIAVTDCQFSCKTALSAGMRCLVIPDEFTAYQDFGGADLVLDKWDDMSAKEILHALTPSGV